MSGVKLYAAVAGANQANSTAPPLLQPWEIDWKSPSALLIGNEGSGLPEEIVRAADARVSIPQATAATPVGIESLNAAMAATVLLYEAMRQRDLNRNGEIDFGNRIGMSLFAKLDPEESSSAAAQPLAERMRPRTLDEFTGQEALLGPGKPLRTQIERDDIGSMILWGPPGCGKTTLARLIARMTHSEFIAFSAVLTGIKEIKDVMAAAEHTGAPGAERSCLSTRFTGSTRRSRTLSFPRGSRKHYADWRDHRKSVL